MQRDYYYPKLADRLDPRSWAEAGAVDIWSRARDEARSLLSSHHPNYLSDAQDRRIRERHKILLPYSIRQGR